MRQKLDLPKPLDGNLWHYQNLGRTHAMHHHAELEFNLVTQGDGLYLLQNRKYRIRRGDLLWLFPAQEHVLVGQSPDFEMWIGVFKPRTVRRLAAAAAAKVLSAANPPGEYCRRLAQRALTWLEELFSIIVATEKPPAHFNIELAYALLAAWQHFERAANVPVQDVHPAVEKAARLIRNDHASARLDELARKSGLSAHRLSRLFKQQTGVALVEFRNRQRVERFLEIYGTGQRRTMLDAALEAGFGSYPQFHRVFKRITGQSPARYRRREAATRAVQARSNPVFAKKSIQDSRPGVWH
ncbi:MAG TPA: helix-turn-helix domain-containing protein [Verrucomicrobiae bacterium]